MSSNDVWNDATFTFYTKADVDDTFTNSCTTSKVTSDSYQLQRKEKKSYLASLKNFLANSFIITILRSCVL